MIIKKNYLKFQWESKERKSALTMKEFTFEEFKNIGRKYSRNSWIITSCCNGNYNTISHSKLLTLFFYSVISFSTEDSLKRFMKEDLLKVDSNILKEIFGWKKVSLKDIVSELLYIIRKDEDNITNTQMMFLFFTAWNINNEEKRCTKKPESNIVNFIKVRFAANDNKMKLAKALSEVDYLDYFNPNDYKKDLFELSMGI